MLRLSARLCFRSFLPLLPFPTPPPSQLTLHLSVAPFRSAVWGDASQEVSCFFFSADLRGGHQGAPQPPRLPFSLTSLLFPARPELQWSQLVEKKPTGGGGWQSKTMCTSTNWAHATHPMAPAPMPVPQMVTAPHVLHSSSEVQKQVERGGVRGVTSENPVFYHRNELLEHSWINSVWINDKPRLD